ncbi:hypothetical protein [Gelria sp. Kuro-4]|nr:hypothetical protein [Gelria sp. Kuro-4]BCV25552.1 hypothetical protein kuro4_23250 [Gelria sp. Kuro-4]
MAQEEARTDPDRAIVVGTKDDAPEKDLLTEAEIRALLRSLENGRGSK